MLGELNGLLVMILKADFHETNCSMNSLRNLTKHAQFEHSERLKK